MKNFNEKFNVDLISDHSLLAILSSILCFCLRLLCINFPIFITSCSNKVVQNLKKLQPDSVKINMKESNTTITQTETYYYPLDDFNSFNISDSLFVFLFLIFICLFFTFPGLLSYFDIKKFMNSGKRNWGLILICIIILVVCLWKN